MSEERNHHNMENNSFFDNEYRKYTDHKSDSCATGSFTLNDLTMMYGMENTTMLKDYETAATRMTHLTKAVQDHTDDRIESLTGSIQDDVRSDYEFDPDELTIGELIAINEEFLKKQQELADTPREPYIASMIASYPGESTEKVSVISVPKEAIASDESPFISIDDIING